MDIVLLDPLKDLSCNPYATEFMGGMDPETPDGLVDFYCEYVFQRTLAANSVDQTGILLFDDDMVIRELRANSNIVTGTKPTDYFIKLRDVDGSFLSNAPIAAQIMFGTGQFPCPFSDWYIPAGYYIGIETTVVGAGGNIELDFIGTIRKRATPV